MTPVAREHGSAERIAALRATKLAALVGDHVGHPVGDPVSFGSGVAVIDDATAWVYLVDEPRRRIGASLAWAVRSSAERLAIVVDERDDARVIVRKTTGLTMEVDVRVAAGRQLVACTDPAEYEHPPAVSPEHLELRPLIVEGGAEPVVEHGVLFGEVRGLEVCRVVDDPTSGSTRLEVGVGAHDREAFQMIHGDVPAVDSLARIVEEVAGYRRADAAHHPLNRLAPERFLRWHLEQHPDLVGAVDLVPAEPPIPRVNLLDSSTCVARGTSIGGENLVVVCGSGTDLELVPDAIDARRAAGIDRGGRVVVATRGRVAITDDLVALAGQAFELVAV